MLADGSSIRFETFGAEVEWDGWRGVVVSAVGNEALVGMGLLAASELRVEAAVGGRVEIQPLP